MKTDGRDQVLDNIFMSFEKMAKKMTSKNTGMLLVHSDEHDIHRKSAFNIDAKVNNGPDQPYHFASIGKTMTSVMTAILYEKDLLDFNDNLFKYLNENILKNLHIYKGEDHTKNIKIKHLLNHTSGLADYYTDKSRDKIRLVDKMVSEPDKYWSPDETIEWTKENLSPIAGPGKRFHYSDTNYQLMGLIIENITGMALHDCYHKFIFKPLGMDNSYMIFHSEPKKRNELPVIDLFYKGINLTKAKSISMSWASGGVVSTSEDMLKFLNAIVHHKIIKPETHLIMQDWAKMSFNIKYGYGLIYFTFPGMSKKYDIWGNSGSIGAFWYYNPAFDTYFIGSFNEMNLQVPPIIFIFNSLRKIKKAMKRKLII